MKEVRKKETKQVQKKPFFELLWVRILMIIIISVGIFLPLLGIYLNYINGKTTESGKLYTANINRNATYKVNLFDNSFVDTTEMKEDKVYISDLVKNIEMSMMYSYSGVDKADLKYKYSIKANLTGEIINNDTNSTEKVWEKDYPLLDQKEEKSDKASFNITEKLDIDFPKYSEEVKEFRKRFGMNLNAKLKIIMNVKITGKYRSNKVNKSDKVIVELPLGNQAFSIKKDFKENDSYSLYENLKEAGISILTYVYLGITIVFIIIFIVSFKTIFNIKPKSEYNRELDKILKNYGEIIVEVNNAVKETGCNIQEVKNFNEMVDLEEELRVPIILYENKRSKTSTFTITHEKTVYKYVLKNRD